MVFPDLVLRPEFPGVFPQRLFHLSFGEDKKSLCLYHGRDPHYLYFFMENSNSVLIQAGGGLVQNEKGELLFIFRRGKWDLPKGKLDPGETLEACALREVREETGLQVLELKKFLLVTLHEYEEQGILLLKESHWYLMYAPGDQILIPQTAEDITDLRWLGQAGFKIILSNTYPSIAEVLRAGGYF